MDAKVAEAVKTYFQMAMIAIVLMTTVIAICTPITVHYWTRTEKAYLEEVAAWERVKMAEINAENERLKLMSANPKAAAVKALVDASECGSTRARDSLKELVSEDKLDGPK